MAQDSGGKLHPSPGMRVRDSDGTCGTIVREEYPFTDTWWITE